MDTNDFRALYTVLVFVVIIGIAWWAYSSKRKESFDAAANSLFEDDEDLVPKRDEAGVSR